jgi:hypothetical protein
MDAGARPGWASLPAFLLRALTLCWCGRTLPRTFDPAANGGYARAGFWSRLYFVWTSELVAFAATVPRLELSDLWPIRKEESETECANRLEAAWAEEQRRRPTNPSLLRVFWGHIAWDLAHVMVLKMGWLLFSTLTNSILLQQLLEQVCAAFAAGWSGRGGGGRGRSSPVSPWHPPPPGPPPTTVRVAQMDASQPLWKGGLLILGYAVCEALRSATVNSQWLHAVLMGMRLRSAARGMLYRKLASIRPGTVDVGKLTNLVIADTSRLLEAAQYLSFIITTPIAVGWRWLSCGRWWASRRWRGSACCCCCRPCRPPSGTTAGASGRRTPSPPTRG